MPKRINKLTPEQEAVMPGWATQWIAHGLSTEPADWQRAERAIAQCYAFAGLTTQGLRFVRVPSPLVMALAAPIAARMFGERGSSVRASAYASVYASVRASVGASVYASVGASVEGSVRDSVYASVGASVEGSVRDSVGDSVGASVGDSVRASVRDSVGDSVGVSVYDSVGDSVEGSVRDSVGDSVGASVYDSVGDSVYASVRDSVGDSVRASVYDSVEGLEWWRYVGGAFWAYWPSMESFFREVCGLKLKGDMSARGQAYAEVSKSIGWWWPHTHFCMMVDRPRHIRLDENGQLHSESGQAIEWRDGWGFHAWHGTRIPAEWIEQTDTIDPRLAITHENIEQRRCLAEIIGWDKVLGLLDAKTVSRDDYGELIDVHLPDVGTTRFIRVQCATDRTFAIPVPIETRTALEGVAWTYQLEPEQYAQLEVRT